MRLVSKHHGGCSSAVGERGDKYLHATGMKGLENYDRADYGKGLSR